MELGLQILAIALASFSLGMVVCNFMWIRGLRK